MESIVANEADANRAWLEAALEDGVEISGPSIDEDSSGFSGQLKLRMPKSLHRSLSVHAKREGISMNQYCLYLLTKNDATYQGSTHSV